MTTEDRPDLDAARAAYAELGKALDSADFSPPESRAWQVRATRAINGFGDALGLLPGLWALPGDPYPDCDGCRRLEFELRELRAAEASPARGDIADLSAELIDTVLDADISMLPSEVVRARLAFQFPPLAPEGARAGEASVATATGACSWAELLNVERRVATLEQRIYALEATLERRVGRLEDASERKG